MDKLPHFVALCPFMFGTGARIGEAAGMCWNDVGLMARTANMQGQKPTPWTRAANFPGPKHAAATNTPATEGNKGDPVFDYPSGQIIDKT